MTTYNGEKYLREQLTSIVNQSYKDIEIIICDDCSKDNTTKIINEFLSSDKRIFLYQNKQNLGFKKNFEKAISLCKGEYIALSDQDDIWDVNHIQKLYDKIGNNYLVCGNNELVNENGISKGLTFFESNLFNINVYKSNEDIFKKIMFSGNCFQGASMLIKTEFAKKILPIPQNVKYHDIWLVSNACYIDKFITTNDIVTYYRQHQAQVTRNIKTSEENSFSKTRISLLDEISKISATEYLSKELISDLYNYHQNISSFIKRVFLLKYVKENYIFIFPDNNSKKKFFRLMKFLFRKQN